MTSDNTRDKKASDESLATNQQKGLDRSGKDALQSAPPGSSIINSSRSGQAISDNPVLRVGRDAGDVLADHVRQDEASADVAQGKK